MERLSIFIQRPFLRNNLVSLFPFCMFMKAWHIVVLLLRSLLLCIHACCCFSDCRTVIVVYTSPQSQGKSSFSVHIPKVHGVNKEKHFLSTSGAFQAKIQSQTIKWEAKPDPLVSTAMWMQGDASATIKILISVWSRKEGLGARKVIMFYEGDDARTVWPKPATLWYSTATF